MSARKRTTKPEPKTEATVMSYPTQIELGTFEEELENLDRIVPELDYDLEFRSYKYREPRTGSTPRVNFTFRITGTGQEQVDGAPIFYSAGFTTDDPFFKRVILALAGEDTHKMRLDINDIKMGRSGNYGKTDKGAQIMGLGDLVGRIVPAHVTVVETQDGREVNNISEFLGLRRS